MYVLGKLRKYLPVVKNRFFKEMFAKFIKPSTLEKLCAQTDADVFLSFMSQKENIIASFIKPEYNNPQAKNIYNEYFSGDFDLAERAMRADIATWLPDESLIRSDKLTMAHGLEERVPFLDKNLVELAFSLPTGFKIKNKIQGKKILRQAVADIVPPFVLKERKRGFFSPASKWLRGGLKPMVYEILSPGYTDKTKEIFNWDEIKNILDNHIAHKKYALNTIWSLMTFQVWAKNYL
jgi:asparagine synthase (glutamine-hydrolysing)